MAEEKKEAAAAPGDGAVEPKRTERGGISRRGLFIWGWAACATRATTR